MRLLTSLGTLFFLLLVGFLGILGDGLRAVFAARRHDNMDTPAAGTVGPVSTVRG